MKWTHQVAKNLTGKLVKRQQQQQQWYGLDINIKIPSLMVN